MTVSPVTRTGLVPPARASLKHSRDLVGQAPHKGIPCGDAAMLRESASQQGPFGAFVTQTAGLDANVTFVPAERLDPITVRQT